MARTERSGDKATCGHPNTGSRNVFINGRGSTRTGADSAGGTITGPGIPSVLVNGRVISVQGDSIVSHGKSPHNNAKTSNPSENVLAG